MAVFVDLDEEDGEPRQDGQPPWTGPVDAVKPVPVLVAAASSIPLGNGNGGASTVNAAAKQREEGNGPAVRESLNQNSMTQALGCYPIVMAIASSIDLNTLDNLSRTCRQIREGLLQYRKMLLVSTLRCTNESLSVDPEDTLRYRARAGNWHYMQDMARGNYNGKSGRCARDLVGGCRRCGTPVCRNCAIKPPAPIALRERHRRLCTACVTAPLGTLVTPRLAPETRADSEYMERAACTCESKGVWLCQPCGRSIRGGDSEYKGIWKWRNQYTEVLGGLGTGIGDGDRGVICGRETACCAAREREQDMDGDAEDAREAEEYHHRSATATPRSNSASGSGSAASSLTPPPPWSPLPLLGGPGSSTSLNSLVGSVGADRRTPSPALKPGYERHEVEGIGGVMKKMRVRMVKVGACVPEWDDERAKGEILGREVQGKRRSWCGWCRRLIPAGEDFETKGKEKE